MKLIRIAIYDIIRSPSGSSNTKTYKSHSGKNMLGKFTEIVMTDILFDELVHKNETYKIQVYDSKESSYSFVTVIPRNSMKIISKRCDNLIRRILNESLYAKYDTPDGKEFVVNTVMTISAFHQLIRPAYKTGGKFFLEVETPKE